MQGAFSPQVHFWDAGLLDDDSLAGGVANFNYSTPFFLIIIIIMCMLWCGMDTIRNRLLSTISTNDTSLFFFPHVDIDPHSP